MWNRALALLVLVSSVSACGGEATTPMPDAAVSTDAAPTPDAPAEEAVEARLERLLTGDFSSQAQSMERADYFDIRLSVCAVEGPELGERVLYVEQAAATSLTAPYRQRLYVVEADEGEGAARSRVFELAEPSAWVGACASSERRSVTAADATEKEGCAVHVRWEAERFVGGTRGEGCESALAGASYATSEVVITESMLESWDRGYDASGAQVWGAVAGPYRFDRVE